MTWDWRVLVGVVVAAAAAGWLLTRSVHESEDTDLVEVDRDLSELTQALRADAATDFEIVPRVSAGIHFPSALAYRRPAEFWRPVLHGRRKGRS